MMQIYKVFINNFFILFTDDVSKIEPTILSKQNIVYKIIVSETSLIKILNKSNFYLETNLIYLCKKPLQSLNKFKSQFKYIMAAGGLVKNNNSELLMIYKNNIWDLPKGKIDINESAESAAIREVQEETNVSKLYILSDYISTFHVYRDNLDYEIKYLKETKWFIMKSELVSDILIPQISEGITKVDWLNFDQLKDLKTYSSIQFLFKYFKII